MPDSWCKFCKKSLNGDGLIWKVSPCCQECFKEQLEKAKPEPKEDYESK